MKIERISVKGFKALNYVTFEPGNVNVFIGANGSGKSTILEAIGVLSAAMTDRVDNSSLDRKGIRLSAPSLYKSSFLDLKKSPTICFQMQWQDGSNQITYDVNLNNPSDDSAWRYHSEALYRNEYKLWGRSGNSQIQYDNRVGMLMLAQEASLGMVRPSAEQLKNYAIYQPSTPILRGISPDKYQASPLGLCGGRLAEAIEELLHEDESGDVMFGELYIDEVLELVDWAANFSVASPKKSSINAAVPTSRRVVEFQDKFMKEKDRFTAYDASEGSLYVLFLLCLAMHDKSPNVFAVDNFDQAMNPRLARATTRLFCDMIKKQNKTAFITTHNPLVLDGLRLDDPAIRLFTVERSQKDGSAQIKRIEVTQELISLDQPLSRLWINGRLGGVPNLL